MIWFMVACCFLAAAAAGADRWHENERVTVRLLTVTVIVAAVAFVGHLLAGGR